MVEEQEADYPAGAVKAKEQGVVWVRALVDETGSVRDANIWTSSGHGLLDSAAVRAAYGCKFTPAVQAGRSVAAWVRYKVQFNLESVPAWVDGPELSADSNMIDVAPRWLHYGKASYPSRSRKSGEEGTVELSAAVDRKGGVSRVELIESSGFEDLDDSALKAARRCRFVPARKAGKSVDCWVKYKVEFSLDKH